jgi:plastocyanin
MLFACALFSSGCDDGTRATDSASDPMVALPQPVFGDGSLRGVVRREGPRPPVKMLDNTSCHASAKAIPDETLLVGPDLGLANAVVWLKSAPGSDGSGQPTVKLDQIDCRYTPHVVALQVGQRLRVTTSDPIFHNTHYLSRLNGTDNFGLSSAGDFKDIRFKHPEFFRVRCDVHKWMSAWIAVMPSPFFATTDESGTFTIDRVPPGHYTIGVWHELLGELEIEASVGSGRSNQQTDVKPVEVIYRASDPTIDHKP